jgi:hypothetical protein
LTGSLARWPRAGNSFRHNRKDGRILDGLAGAGGGF